MSKFHRFLAILLLALPFAPAARGAEPHDRLVDFGEDRYTFSAWVKVTDGAGPILTVGPLDGEWKTGCKCLYMDEGGHINLRIAGGGHSRGPNLRDGKWHHLVLPSLQNWRFYIDGRPGFTHIIDGVPDPGMKRNPVKPGQDCVMKLGQGVNDYPNDAPRQLVAEIDDVRLYDRMLSENEITEHFQGKTQFPDAKLLAHWTMDDELTDATGDGNDLHAIGQIKYAEGHGEGTCAVFDGTNALWLPLSDPADTRQGRVITATLPEPTRPTYGQVEFGQKLVDELGFRELLFVERQTYTSSHFYSDYIDGCDRFGSNICILDLLTGKVKKLFDGKMTEGIFGRVDLSFDATKIVFGWKASEWEGFRIYEANIDGTGLKQLTFPPDDEELRIKKYDQSSYIRFANIFHHQTDDMHPCYLPDGGIMFASSRCEYGTLCNSDDQLCTTVLYRIDGDGSNMEKLTNSAVSEFTPTLMEDGRVLYTRWEYVDKGQIGVKCLWSMNADGTATKEVYGNNVRFPPTFIQGRQIPGKSNLIVAIGSPHWPQTGTGTVVMIDTSKPIRTLQPLSYVTPYVKVMQEPGYNQYDFETKRWTRSGNGPLYRDPFPLAEDKFIVSHNPDREKGVRDATAYGLYVLNTKCEHRLIYDDPESSAWCAQPLRPRRKPPITAMPRDDQAAQQGLAICSVQDIYHGMEDVQRGEVKWIRIMEQLPRPWSSRRRWQPACGHTQLSGGWPLGIKALRGVVPVEEDGSAHFYVPADRNIFFQALNEDFLELQRERTYVNYRPGEVRACIGCHETPDATPPRYTTARIAMTKPPVMPMPQPGDSAASRPLHYATDVEPILQKHCVRCHGEEDPAAGLRLTGEHTWLSSTSFQNLLRYGAVPGFRESSDFDGTEYMPAKTIGSYVSPLIAQLQKGCPGNDQKLSQAEFVRIATWIDTNGTYHGSYWGRIVPPHKDHPNYRPIPTIEQALGTENPYEEWTPDWTPPAKE